MIIVFVVASKGLSMIVTFVPGMIISYIFYLLTVFKKHPEGKFILPLYLLGVGWQAIHFAEEYLTGYNEAFPALFGAEPYPADQFVISNMIALLFYAFSGACMELKIQGPQLIAIFFIIFGGLINAIMHVIFSIKSGGYFPGLYTALPFFLAPLLIYMIWKSTR